MPYKLGSLFDGSGGFPLSGSLCGIEPRWAAEVEPYPIAVTRTRFPNMHHLGDISKVSGADIEPVDIITFGSPCQDLSVAGKRAGLKHAANGDDETTRSGLFMEAVRIIKEMREATNGLYPRFALWENVPGAFSSNKGEDFRIVCEELIKVVEPSASMPSVPQKGWTYADSYIGDGWSLAYRVFDAQHWGVPQRRRRIHLVVDFRGTSAREVLFEREGVRGYFTEGRTPWQAAPTYAQDCAGADDREGEGADGTEGERGRLDAVAYTLKIRSGVEVDANGKAAGKGPLVQVDKAATLSTVQDQYLFAPTAYSFDSLASNSMKSKNPHSGCREVDVAKTLDTTDPSPNKNQGGIAIVEPVAYSIENHPADSRVNIDESGKVQTLTSRMGTGGGNVPMVMEPVAYDGANVTSPINASNPQPGDPCHTLSTDSRNYLVERDPVYCLQGNGIDRADTAGCNGKGWKEDQSYTLNTIDRPAVCYSMKSIARNGKVLTEQANPICASDYKDPDIVAHLASGKETVGTLMANAGTKLWLGNQEAFSGDYHIIEGKEIRYIVRRLTPTECARLQGFADRWGDIVVKDSFTPEEYEFWLNVRNTHAAINDKKVQDYTEAQMVTWYNKLQSDANEYKMWGNGIALPPALYCMQGITDALNKEEDDEWLL